MRFHNKALDYGKVKHPDVIELSTPLVEMNNVLKSLETDNQISQVKMQIAQVEHDNRLKVIEEYYHDIDDGSQRDQAIINEIRNFADTIEVLRYLDEESAGQALIAISSLTREVSLNKDVIELTTPLVRINTMASEALSSESLSDEKKLLILQAVDETRGLIGELEDDQQYVDDLIYGLKESIGEVVYMNEDEASELAVEEYSYDTDVEGDGELAEVIDLSTIRD